MPCTLHLTILDDLGQGHRPQPMIQPLTAEQMAEWERWIDFHSLRVSRTTPPDPFCYLLIALLVAFVIYIFTRN